jgi:hypothetical protein
MKTCGIHEVQLQGQEDNTVAIAPSTCGTCRMLPGVCRTALKSSLDGPTARLVIVSNQDCPC